jgi:serine/threonine-protein kinase
MAPDVKGGALNIYWGDYYKNTIAIYPRSGINPPEKGVITKGLSHPQRLFVDGALTVYATNAGNNTITAYKRHATKPSLKISTGVNDPTGLTVDAAGTVYCANVGNDTVTVYPKGQTTPSLTIPIAGAPEYLAVDASGNLYVSYLGGPTGTGVMEFAPASSTGKDLGLDISGGGALEVDRSGNIILIDDYGLTIDVFAAGQTEPSKKIGVGGGEIFGLSLSEKERKVFVSVETGGWFIVQQLDYPGLTSPTTKLATGAGNWPIAVSPDAAL